MFYLLLVHSVVTVVVSCFAVSAVTSLSARFRRSLLLRPRRQLTSKLSPLQSLSSDTSISRTSSISKAILNPGRLSFPKAKCGGDRYSGGQAASGKPKFRIAGYFKNDLFTKIRETASKLIDDAVDFVSNGLKRAQGALDKAIADVRKLDNDINHHKGKIRYWKNECKIAKWPKKILKCAEAGVKIVWHGVAETGIQIAKEVAIAALKVARLALQALDVAIKVSMEVDYKKSCMA